MAIQNSELFQVWAKRLSFATAFMVVLLSWLNGVRLQDLMIRAAVSFGVMYLLMAGILSLFEKTALQIPPLIVGGDLDSGRGAVIDFSVGDDEIPGQGPKFPGQVDPGLSTGLPDSEQQADIGRRMGWD